MIYAFVSLICARYMDRELNRRIRTYFIGQEHGNTGMREKLSEVFENHHRSLLKVDKEGFFDVNVELVEEASNRDTAIIYVATKKPYLMLKKALKENGVEHDALHFVDCIIKTITNEKLPDKDDNILYLKRTDDLRNISTAVSTVENTASKKKAVLIIDSLATLLAAHGTKDVARFITDIQERLNTTKMNLVLFDEGRDVEDKIGQEIYDVVDNVIFLRRRSE